MLTQLFYYLGGFGPLILFFVSLAVLWKKHNLLFYYTIGIFANVILNIVLKGIFQCPRPLDDPKIFNVALKNGRNLIFNNYIPFDIFGMPSGHSQSAAFSTLFIFFALKNYHILYFYLIIAIITMIQRVVYYYHTVFQVFVGILFGAAFGYYMYYLAQQKLKGKIREKPDDFGPI